RELAVGYGYINEEDLIYAASHLEQENNDFCNYANIFDLIKGRFSGVTVSGNNVYIRGSGSFTGQTQALYILNGVETGSIDWISPCQIKSIDILKDSNAAIYGARGGNGVVIINTNK
ncbi:MAG: TonB-dependent receptor plug domain-containing protein, partial [Bacteroidetes bacterium]|nr:TonB-dependent receptor plug domain-containing protein [Bacteroidota bacterium]